MSQPSRRPDSTSAPGEVPADFDPLWREDDIINLGGMAAAIKAYWLQLLLAGLFGAGATYAASYAFTPIFGAESLLSVVSQEESGGGGLKALAGRYASIAGLMGVELPAGDYSEAAVIALLTSHRFVEKFIGDHDLLPLIFPKRWDAASKQWKDVSETKPAPTVQDGADVFLKKVLSVVQDRKTRLITVRMQWHYREQVAGWTNELVTEANEMTRQLAINNSDESIKYLNKELQNVQSVELQQAIYGLLQSQMNKRMIAVTRPDFSFRVIDPARTPALKDRVSPRRVEFALVGFFLVSIAGMLIATRALKRRIA